MSKYTAIFDWLRTCPQLENLYSIASTEDIGVRVILPQGASPAVAYDEKWDALDGYECKIKPYPSVYEDFQVNCFEYYDAGDTSEPQDNGNVLTLEQVQSVCDWIKTQDEEGNFPEIEGYQIVSVECNPFVPQIRYVNNTEYTIGYYITIRIRYVNPFLPRVVYYENQN